MVHKRKRDEPETITYGSDVPWLQSLINQSTSSTSGDDFDVVPRDPALAAFTDDEVFWEASKVAYLLYHNLDAKSDILRSIGVACDTYKYQDWAKQLSPKQSQWKGAILNKFLLAHVRELIRKWRVANPWRTFEVLPAEERIKIWMEVYDADPKRTSISMFKPIIGGLDMSNAFNRELASDEDKVKMSAVRVMLRNKYLFGCEITYKHRIQADKKDACFEEWTKYMQDESFSQTVVPVEDLPISSKLLTPQEAPVAKKRNAD